MLNLKLVLIKNILSRWLHIGCLASHIIIFFASQLNVLASHDFFTGQLNVLASRDYYFFYWPTQRVGLLQCSQMDLIGSLLVAFLHARKILLEVLAIDSYRKLDTI